ncbi:hypothetical protein RZS08_42540, partial [Arthrospira platensis SPKY1]|nr:hypothetical protein [Arthrospira platensis SPKY1]
KMGDVNGTWATPMPLLLASALNWAIPDAALKAGQPLRVPFRANGLPDVAAWQFALRFDTDYLRFERALPTAAFPLNPSCKFRPLKEG